MMVTQAQREEVFRTGRAPAGWHFFVVVYSKQRHVSGWGKAATLGTACRIADRMRRTHDSGTVAYYQCDLVRDEPVREAMVIDGYETDEVSMPVTLTSHANVAR